MSPTVQSLGIDQLPREQRLRLIQEILDTIIAEEAPPVLSEARRRELERRVAEDEASPDDVIPWEQVKAQTLARLKQS